MSEKTRIEKFEGMLRQGPGRTTSQYMYLDLLRAWMKIGFMETVTAAELASQINKEYDLRDQPGQARGTANLLTSLVEMGLAIAEHDANDTRTFRLSAEGYFLVERLHDVIAASKSREGDGGWSDF